MNPSASNGRLCSDVPGAGWARPLALPCALILACALLLSSAWGAPARAQEPADSAGAEPGPAPSTIIGPVPAPRAADLQSLGLDDDGDGVPNASDRCPDTPAAVEVSTDGCPVESGADWRIVIGLGALVVLVGAFLLHRWWRSAYEIVPDDYEGRWPVPPLVFDGRGGQPPPADRTQAVRERASPPEPAAPAPPRAPGPVGVPAPAPAAGGAAVPQRRPASAGRRWLQPGTDGLPVAGGGDLYDAGTVRFHMPMDGTLQLLPGRLELIQGTDRPGEIRFVRLPGREPEVTFGRRPGPPHEHIQLMSPTVSRRHARLTFDNGRWLLENLSGTNPVVLNGERLSPGGPARPLADGDRLEMGEVVFRYRAS